MLTKEDNEILTRVGPGSPMGNLMRRYWIPALISSELPERDGSPLRLRLLGENLIAFRDSEGRVGLLGDSCSHRGASLFFGRNEEAGLRCVYHGWKYDVSGACVDMPNEPAESNFKDKIRHLAYPCVEKAGVIWTYMGQAAAEERRKSAIGGEAEPLSPGYGLPDLPDLEWASLPESHLRHAKILRECNWIQALEGDIDSSHVSYLHSSLGGNWAAEAARRGNSKFWEYEHHDRSPTLEVLDTSVGVMYGARRRAESDTYYWRIAHFLMPFYTMIPPIGPRAGVGTRIWVPVDDEHVMYWSMTANPFEPIRDEDRARLGSGAPLAGDYAAATTDWIGQWRLAANRTNDYFIDRDAQKTNNYTGITGTNLQDHAITESMGSIYDRSHEHLGTADAMIVRVRKRLIDAAKALRDRSETPPGAADVSIYRVRPASVVLPRDADWIKATARERQAFTGEPVASI